VYSRLNPKEAAKKQRQCTGGILKSWIPPDFL
jgi:hypothetical protein